MLLEDQYDTIIGEKGSNLSGGQRRRITLARAFLKNTPLLVLDEATASLKVQSEKLVYETMDQLMLDKTVVVIAHRMSTIQQMDKIIVIDQGAKVEEGNHEELMANEGFYYHLIQSQFIENGLK